MTQWQVIEHQGKRYRVMVAQSSHGIWIGWRGGSTFLAKKSQFVRENGHDESILAPMTGKIVKVLVGVGDTVAEGQLLVVMEAMKMEYRLTAPKHGVVHAVGCKVGELVDLGASLVVLAE